MGVSGAGVEGGRSQRGRGGGRCGGGGVRSDRGGAVGGGAADRCGGGRAGRMGLVELGVSSIALLSFMSHQFNTHSCTLRFQAGFRPASTSL